MKFLLKAATAVSVTLLSASVTAQTCLPLTDDSDLCAYPPGTISSDGDDVCVLVPCCVPGSPAEAEIPNGTEIACNVVNCTSVCDLSPLRSSLASEACNSVCTAPAAATTVASAPTAPVAPSAAPTTSTDCIALSLELLSDFFPETAILTLATPFQSCVSALTTLEPLQSCVTNACQCFSPIGCEAQIAFCSVLCGATNLPPSCVEFLEGIISIFPLGQEFEEIEKIRSIVNLLAAALNCLFHPGPFILGPV